MYEIVERPSEVEGNETSFVIAYRFIGKQVHCWEKVEVVIVDDSSHNDDLFLVCVYGEDFKEIDSMWYFKADIDAIKKARDLVNYIKGEIKKWGN